MYGSGLFTALGAYSPGSEKAVPCTGWMGSNGYMMYGKGGWDPSGESEESKPEQVRQCMDLEHCLHSLHLEPTHRVWFYLHLDAALTALSYARCSPGRAVQDVLVDRIQRIYDGG
jgi:hypothetical protein